VKVTYKNEKTRKLCEDAKTGQKQFGDVAARQLRKRIRMLLEADTLSDIPHTPPPRLHLLSGYKEPTCGVVVYRGLRIVLEPADDPLPFLDDGGVDKRRVRSVQIVTVEDYHG
jgi:proteic killer suppression protein